MIQGNDTCTVECLVIVDTAYGQRATCNLHKRVWTRIKEWNESHTGWMWEHWVEETYPKAG